MKAIISARGSSSQGPSPRSARRCERPSRSRCGSARRRVGRELERRAPPAQLDVGVVLLGSATSAARATNPNASLKFSNENSRAERAVAVAIPRRNLSANGAASSSVAEGCPSHRARSAASPARSHRQCRAGGPLRGGLDDADHSGPRAREPTGATGLEPAASGVTGRRSNQSELRPRVKLETRDPRASLAHCSPGGPAQAPSARPALRVDSGAARAICSRRSRNRSC